MRAINKPRAQDFPSAFLISMLAALSLGVHSAERCDLVTPSQCLDLEAIQGKTITVPRSVTRVDSRGGLAFCQKLDNRSIPVDFIFIVDHSGSMTPDGVWISSDKNDTVFMHSTGKSSENDGRRNFPSGIGSACGTFELNRVDGSAKSIPAYCGGTKPTVQIAGDPYGTRSKAVRDAIDALAAASPQSTAGYVGFHEGPIDIVPNVRLDKVDNISKVKNSIVNKWGAGTHYDKALQQARLWAADSSLMKNDKQVIILVSDGKPSGGGTWNKYRDSVAGVFDGFGKPKLPLTYGIFLGGDGAEELDTLSNLTGGSFHQLPARQSDNLSKVMVEIVNSVTRNLPFASVELSNKAADSRTYTAKAKGFSHSAAASRLQLDKPLALSEGDNVITVDAGYGAPVNSSGKFEFTIRVTGEAAPSNPRLSTRCQDAGRFIVQLTSAAPSDGAGIRAMTNEFNSINDALNGKSVTLFLYHPGLGAIGQGVDRDSLKGIFTITGSITNTDSSRPDREEVTLEFPNDSATDLGLLRARDRFTITMPAAGATPGNGAFEPIRGDSLIVFWQHPHDPRDFARLALEVEGPVSVPVTDAVYRDFDGDGRPDRVEVTLNVSETAVDLDLVKQQLASLAWPVGVASTQVEASGADKLIFTLEVDPEVKVPTGADELKVVAPKGFSRNGFLRPGSYPIRVGFGPVLMEKALLAIFVSDPKNPSVDGFDTLWVTFSTGIRLSSLAAVPFQGLTGADGKTDFTIRIVDGSGEELADRYGDNPSWRRYRFLVQSISSALPPKDGDPIWIHPQGGVEDAQGNKQTLTQNRRAPIEIKPKPLVVEIKPIAQGGVSRPNTDIRFERSFAVHAPNGGCIERLNGENLVAVTALPEALDFNDKKGGVGGFRLRVNQPVEAMTWVIYSHLGEYVNKGGLSFKDPKGAFLDGHCFLSSPSSVDLALLEVAWDGSDERRMQTASGVYIFKVNIRYASKQLQATQATLRIGRVRAPL